MASVTQAFVLGAGLGTRLRPLTDDLPKPLVPIFQKPLITFALDHLIDVGVGSFVINTHKSPERFARFFAGTRYRGCEVTLVHESDLLETGGGIKNAEGLLRPEPFITYSGDVLTDIELQRLIDEHFRRCNDVTLALRETGLAAAVAYRDGRIIDLANRYGVPGNYDFANVAIWSPEIFQRIPGSKKISFIPVIADWIGQGGKIGGLVLNQNRWFNIGSRADYLEIHRVVAAESWKPSYLKTPDWPVKIAPDAAVAESARLTGFYSIGSGCEVGAEAILGNTIVWPGSQIASRSDLRGCIVRSHKKVSGTHRDIDL
jgi:mannose-1-phosphate guanylyltransferase